MNASLRTVLGLIISTVSFSVSANASDICNSKLTRLDVIQLVSSSEALAIQAGPRSDVSTIEVFAISADGHNSKINVTFAGTVGNSIPVTYKASLNCAAGGVIELEQ